MTIRSAEYVRAAERTDGNDSIVGDVIIIRFNECNHIGFGAPYVTYTPGERWKCRKCADSPTPV